jgi:trans-aconitate methyltransferase
VPPRLYRELVSWYRLVDPTRDHLDEATSYQAALEGAASPRPETLLELGSGAGNNAFYLKRRFRCTLTDLSEEMLGLSRELNPECEHHRGDMRTLRLGRSFDAVFVHDAIMYLTTEADLRAVAATAFAHTRSGGAAVFAPDCLRETFKEQTNLLSEAEGRRALRGIEWSWDPDPADDTFVTHFGFLLRDGDVVRAEHDHHVEGLFARATWLRVLASAGYRVETAEVALGEGQTGEIFVCRRP